ncbi:Rid family hydrolase [Streptomyces sp. NPDC004609]|uniref:Rid family hydrolase n=1 Tax=Streptomyces sp. NPDC004609 TaxID=3364704 RepID=UPI0036CC94D7
MTDQVVRKQSRSPWEEPMGCAGAVAAGDRVLVGGTTAFKGLVLHGEGDPYAQAVAAFRHGLVALADFGLDAASVIRTRMYLTHARDVDAVGRAHGEIFGSVRPVTTLVIVSGFVDPRILVEVELEAYVPGAEDGDWA